MDKITFGEMRILLELRLTKAVGWLVVMIVVCNLPESERSPTLAVVVTCSLCAVWNTLMAVREVVKYWGQ